MPFLSTNQRGIVTARSRLIQEGLISRISTRFCSLMTLENHLRFRVVALSSCSLLPSGIARGENRPARATRRSSGPS
jgi:hypothetical protein